MSQHTIDQLVDQLKQGQISRRGFVRRATAIGVSASAAAMLARGAVAQEGTPAGAPSDSPVAITSITRDEVEAAIQEEFQFSEPENQGGTVIHVVTTDIQTLNPTLANDVYSSWITGLLFPTLIGTNPVDGTPAPNLVDYWEVSEDNLTYTYHINPNATWHDGTPVTSADVEFTFNSVLDETSLSVRRGTVAAQLKELIVIDDKTFQMVALAPSAIFITDTGAQFGILPKHIWENVAFADFGTDPGSTGQDPSRVVGCGPFKFVEWVRGENVTLERNAEYWDEANVPNIDQYILRMVGDGNAALQSVITGESDIFIGVPYTQVEPTRQGNPDLDLFIYETVLFNFYHTNQNPEKEELFLDIPVRQALQYGLDRQLIADVAYQGFAEPANGTQPVLSWAYAPDRINTVYNYDPDLARQLLEEAGWVDSDGDGIREKDGRKFSFEMIYSEGVVTYEQQVPYMQQAWREIGIEMIPTQIPFPTLSAQVEAGDHAMCLQGFSWSLNGSQDIMFACDRTPPNGFNRMHYCNPEYDALEEAARTELDYDTRIDLLIQASNIVNDEAAIGVIVFRNDITVAGPNLNNYHANGYGQLWALTKVWVNQ